ncbi:sodium:solute symporter family protein [Anaeromicropila populeti]|uniref:Sodium/proline symporter n=1 Tax=Anaeromicropila populeti TaxID=37658 RepID=A0A1I6LFA1_9FIRM|nr:sodium:solute symporter [Anaeromicropila populeti]SFS02123.1 sodium/proline symporter [Anaeromicropila populeti]
MEYIICLVVYLAVMVGVSLYARRRTSSVTDFALGGRSIPPWMSAFSYGTAYFSAVILIGHAGKNGWTFGMSAFWVVFGNSIIGTYLAWKVLGKRTREMTQRLEAATMPQFIAIRYKDQKLRSVTSFIIFVFLVPYAASVYKGLGFLFQLTFGIDEKVIMLIMTVVTAFYLVLGGFLAASIADFIQGVIMIIGIVLLVFYILSNDHVGGLVNGMESLKAINPDLVAPITKNTAIPLVSLVLMTSLGTWGLPQMVSKFYTIKSEKFISTAAVVSTMFALIVTIGAYTMGSMSRLILNNTAPANDNGGIVYDKIIPMVLNTDGIMPTVVLAVLLIVILAASMSTLASIVLASSTTFVMDLVKPLAKDKLNEKHTVLLLRICCLCFVAAAYILAMGNSPILNLNALSWGVVSGTLLAPYLIGLYWKRATKAGVYASMLTAVLIMMSAVVTAGLNSPYITTFSASAMIVPNVVLIIVSLATKKLDESHITYIFNKK